MLDIAQISSGYKIYPHGQGYTLVACISAVDDEVPLADCKTSHIAGELGQIAWDPEITETSLKALVADRDDISLLPGVFSSDCSPSAKQTRKVRP